MWIRRESRQGRAVLAALASVGEAGMTPLTLAVITDLPETRLDTVLAQPTRAGLVDRRTDPLATVTQLGRSRYLLASTAGDAINVPA